MLKAHTSDANVKAIVHSAIHTLMPALPSRIASTHSDDATTLLGHLTKRILLDDGQQPMACAHILSLIIRHQKLYYPVRFQILELCCQGMSRILHQSSSLTFDNKKLIVDLCEVIIKWEQQRMQEDAATQPLVTVAGPPPSAGSDSGTTAMGSSTATTSFVGQSSQPTNQTSFETTGDSARRSRHISGASSSITKRPMERSQCDTVVNCLIRVASYADSSSSNQAANQSITPGNHVDSIGKRSLCLLKSVVCQEMWPNPEIQLQWVDRLLCQAESAANAQQHQQAQSSQHTQQQNSHATVLNSICACLETLAFVISVINNKEQILSAIKQIQQGLGVAVRCTNLRVANLVQLVIGRVFACWPPCDLSLPPQSMANGQMPSPPQYSPREELETLYATCGKVICDSILKVDKVQPLSFVNLTPAFLLLRTARVHSLTYADKILPGFVYVMLRLTKDHLQADSSTQNLFELIMIGLELMKGRTSVMSVETQKDFLTSIVLLIDKSQEPKIIKLIIKIVESKTSGSGVPTARDRTGVLTRLFLTVEQRFGSDEEINTLYYSLILHIYRDDSLKSAEAAWKLEPAFLCGLKSKNAELRSKFFETLNSNIPRSLIERLLYITSSQNWESIGRHYWIKQCAEIVLTGNFEIAKLFYTNI